MPHKSIGDRLLLGAILINAGQKNYLILPLVALSAVVFCRTAVFAQSAAQNQQPDLGPAPVMVPMPADDKIKPQPQAVDSNLSPGAGTISPGTASPGTPPANVSPTGLPPLPNQTGTAPGGGADAASSPSSPAENKPQPRPKEVMPNFSNEPGQVFQKEGPPPAPEPEPVINPAGESPSKPLTNQAKSESSTSGEEAASSKKTAKKKTSILVAGASFVTGWVCGTPTAIVRATGKDLRKDARDVLESQPNIILATASSPLVFPAGIFSGTCKGLWYGFRNSVMYSLNKPFGKDCFSLGKLNDTGSEEEDER